MAINYYTMGESSVDGITEKIPDEFNPQFAYTQETIDEIQNIAPHDLAEAVPYIRLVLLDLEGVELVDFTKEFFFKNPDLTQPFNGDIKYPNRPIASLVGVTIKKDNGGMAGTGTISLTEISLEIVIHRLEALQNTKMKAFIFTGLPFKITYGWSNPKNNLLNQKETFVFNTQTYEINFDNSGQITLTVRGQGHKQSIQSTNLGDDGSPIEEEIKAKQSQGINVQREKIKKYLEYVQDQNTAVLQIKKDFAIPQEERSASLQVFLAKYKDIKAAFVKNTPSEAVSFGEKQIQCYTLHSIIQGLMAKSLESLRLLNKADKLRLIYGTFADGCGSTYSNKNIGNFYVPKKEFLDLLKEQDKIKTVPTITDMFDLLINEFLKEPKYYKIQQANKEKEDFSMPSIQLQIKTIQHTLKDDAKTYLDIYIFDAGYNIPDILSEEEKVTGNLTQDKIEEQVRKSGIPIIKYGNTNSFFSNASIATNMDESMRSVYISRIYENVIGSPRTTVKNNDEVKDTETIPLILPLNGTIETIGLTQWVPFKVMYISFGSYLFNNIYQIISVSHRIDNSGFTSTLEFRPT
jgi:hypothetical protein